MSLNNQSQVQLMKKQQQKKNGSHKKGERCSYVVVWNAGEADVGRGLKT